MYSGVPMSAPCRVSQPLLKLSSIAGGEPLGDAEVEHLEPLAGAVGALGQHDVVGLDVAVDDAAASCARPERAAELDDEPRRARLGHPAASARHRGARLRPWSSSITRK